MTVHVEVVGRHSLLPNERRANHQGTGTLTRKTWRSGIPFAASTVAYYRDFYNVPNGPRAVRAIKTATSRDFVNWSKGALLKYGGIQHQALYTNQIAPYARAPHIFIGFPKRYVDRGWVDSTGKLPGLKERKARANAHPRYGSVVTDSLMITSRDGLHFKRWDEAIIRPGPSHIDSWVYGDNMISWGILSTPSNLPQGPDELSIYAIEGYWTGKSQKFRRYTFRTDGFVSVQAPLKGGEFTTKPLIFKGDELEINYSTSAAGSIYVEIQDADRKPIAGRSLADCHEVFGDQIKRTIAWKNRNERQATGVYSNTSAICAERCRSVFVSFPIGG